MLLMNKTLLKLARGLWLLIFAIAGVGFLTLMGTTALAEIIAGFLGSLFQPQAIFKHSLKRHPGCAGSCCVYLCRPAFKGPSGIQNGCQSAGRYAENDLFKGTGTGRRRN